MNTVQKRCSMLCNLKCTTYINISFLSEIYRENKFYNKNKIYYLYIIQLYTINYKSYFSI